MVINVGALKSGDHQTVLVDIAKVVDSAHEAGAIVKVILETSLLTDAEKVVASSLAKKAKADFVKNLHRIRWRRGNGVRRGTDA